MPTVIFLLLSSHSKSVSPVISHTSFEPYIFSALLALLHVTSNTAPGFIPEAASICPYLSWISVPPVYVTSYSVPDEISTYRIFLSSVLIYVNTPVNVTSLALTGTVTSCALFVGIGSIELPDTIFDSFCPHASKDKAIIHIMADATARLIYPFIFFFIIVPLSLSKQLLTVVNLHRPDNSGFSHGAHISSGD